MFFVPPIEKRENGEIPKLINSSFLLGGLRFFSCDLLGGFGKLVFKLFQVMLVKNGLLRC